MALQIPQIRHALRQLLPPWLRRPYGDSFTTEGLFTIYDLDAEYMRDALLARWPSYAPTDALVLIARDRRVPIGPAEPPEVTRVRLLLWLDIAQLAGLPLGLLIALQGALFPDFPLARVVTQASLWYTLDQGAAGRLLGLPGFEALPPTTYEQGPFWPVDATPASGVERMRHAGLYQRLAASPPNWDWDSLSLVAGSGARWGAWVILFSVAPNAWIAPDGMWGEPGVWGDGGAWGVDAPVGVGQLLQTIVRASRSSLAWVRWLIVSFDAALFDPSQAAGGGVNPDGHFGRWSKIVNGQYVPARFASARYGDGAP